MTTDTWGYSDEERQGLVDAYSTISIQLMLEDPSISMQQITDYLGRVGPWQSKGRVIGIFRGGPILHQTTDRMNVIRMVAPRDEVGGLPLICGFRMVLSRRRMDTFDGRPHK